MNTVDSVEKKKCTNCTIMNYVMIITAIAVIALMSSCVPPSSLREGRVVGYNSNLSSNSSKKEIKEKDEEVKKVEQKVKVSENELDQAYNETFANNKSSTSNEPRIKGLEDQLKDLKKRDRMTNQKVDNIQEDIKDIKSTLSLLKTSIENFHNNSNQTASIGSTNNNAEYIVESDESMAGKNSPIIVTANTGAIEEPKEEDPKFETVNLSKNSKKQSTDFTLAEKYLEKKDYHRAIRELKELELKLNDEIEKGECRFLLGESHYHLKQYAKAIHYFAKVLESPEYSDRDKVQVILAESHIKAGESSKAKNVYKTLLNENPRSEYVPVARKMLQQL